MKQKDVKTNKNTSENPIVNIHHYVDPQIKDGNVDSIRYRKTIEYKDGSTILHEQVFNMRIIPFDAAMNIISSCMTGQMYGNSK